MQARLTTKPVPQVIAGIQVLDLESVKIRLMDPKVGEGWTREYADSIEVGYKTYLTMVVKYQDHAEDILLSKDVDEFWHTHILQTAKYVDDCEAVFGKYLHHAPHIGEITEADAARRDAQAEKTRQLYQREFGSMQNAESAWFGVSVDVENAESTGSAIRVEQAAVSAVFAGNGIAAEQAAVSAVYVSKGIATENAAVSAAFIKKGIAAQNAAVSAVFAGRGIEAGNAAVSAVFAGRGIATENAAVSAVFIKKGITAEHAAVSAVFAGKGISAENAAVSAVFSGKGITVENAAVSAVFAGKAVAAENAAVIA